MFFCVILALVYVSVLCKMSPQFIHNCFKPLKPSWGVPVFIRPDADHNITGCDWFNFYFQAYLLTVLRGEIGLSNNKSNRRDVIVLTYIDLRGSCVSYNIVQSFSLVTLLGD